MANRRGFTLTELLVVVAIISIVAAILFPVLSAAQIQARKSVCLSNHRSAYQATYLYIGDYDDRFMPVSYVQDGANSRNDRTWVQMLMPYTKSFPIFRCPGDHSNARQGDATFDEDLVPGDTTSKYYQASKKSNLGYNYLYLAPVNRAADQWFSSTRYYTDVEDPGDTYLFVDTVSERNSDGSPNGGGNYLVIPPCRYQRVNGFTVDTFSGAAGRGPEMYAQNSGWTVSNRFSKFYYGSAWPWHHGRITVTSVGGSVKAILPDTLARGCDVRDEWKGYIQDPGTYAWSSHLKFGQ